MFKFSLKQIYEWKEAVIIDIQAGNGISLTLDFDFVDTIKDYRKVTLRSIADFVMELPESDNPDEYGYLTVTPEEIIIKAPYVNLTIPSSEVIYVDFRDDWEKFREENEEVFLANTVEILG